MQFWLAMLLVPKQSSYVYRRAKALTCIVSGAYEVYKKQQTCIHCRLHPLLSGQHYQNALYSKRYNLLTCGIHISHTCGSCEESYVFRHHLGLDIDIVEVFVLKESVCFEGMDTEEIHLACYSGRQVISLHPKHSRTPAHYLEFAISCNNQVL